MHTRQYVFSWSAIASALLPSALWAHPGHGTTDPQSAAHYAEPLHTGPILVAALCAVSAMVLLRRMRSAKLARQAHPIRER